MSKKALLSAAITLQLVMYPAFAETVFTANEKTVSISVIDTATDKVVVIDRKTHRIVNEWRGSQFTGDPHGIWATADNAKLYLGHEPGGRVTVIELNDPNNPNDDIIRATISDPMVKRIIDVVIKC